MYIIAYFACVFKKYSHLGIKKVYILKPRLL